jgi:hypothetical protein
VSFVAAMARTWLLTLGRNDATRSPAGVSAATRLRVWPFTVVKSPPT